MVKHRKLWVIARGAGLLATPYLANASQSRPGRGAVPGLESDEVGSALARWSPNAAEEAAHQAPEIGLDVREIARGCGSL